MQKFGLHLLLVWVSSFLVCARATSQPADYGASLLKYELVKVLDVVGRQGIATDGEKYFVSGSKGLYIYSKDGELLKSNEDPFAEGFDKPANHIGDISVHDGEIYVGAEYFDAGRGTNIQLAIYDAETLKFKRSLPWDPSSGQVEVSSVAVDVPNGLVWMTDWVSSNFVYKYRLSDGQYAGKIHLRPNPQWTQGIASYGGSLYITADDGDADRKEADNLWRVSADYLPNASAAFIRHEHTFNDFRDLGEIEGVAFDEAADEMLVLAARGKQIVLGIPKGLYPGYDREIHEVYVFRIEQAQTAAGGRRALGSIVLMCVLFFAGL